jgi:hypothetical protein
MAPRRNPRSSIRPAGNAPCASVTATLAPDLSRNSLFRCRFTPSQHGRVRSPGLFRFQGAADRSAIRRRLCAGAVVMRDAWLRERSSGPRQRHGNGSESDTAGKRQCDRKLGKRQFHHGRLHVSSPWFFRAPPNWAFQPLYCNAQFFDRRVRISPLKCREISKMKAASRSPWNRCAAIFPPPLMGAKPECRKRRVCKGGETLVPRRVCASSRPAGRGRYQPACPPLSCAASCRPARCAARAERYALPQTCGHW